MCLLDFHCEELKNTMRKLWSTKAGDKRAIDSVFLRSDKEGFRETMRAPSVHVF